MNLPSTLHRGLVAAAMLASLAAPLAHAETAPAPAGDTKTAAPKPASEEKTTGNAASAKPEAKKRTRAEVEAFLAKCSQEADEKGLDVKKGKGAERKAFRRECMKKFGVEAK